MKLKELIKEEEIKVGDRVYYRVRMGHFPRTISGVVTKIDGDNVTIRRTTQNTYGKPDIVAMGKLTKSKKQ